MWCRESIEKNSSSCCGPRQSWVRSLASEFCDQIVNTYSHCEEPSYRGQDTGPTWQKGRSEADRKIARRYSKAVWGKQGSRKKKWSGSEEGWVWGQGWIQIPREMPRIYPKDSRLGSDAEYQERWTYDWVLEVHEQRLKETLTQWCLIVYS